MNIYGPVACSRVSERQKREQIEAKNMQKNRKQFWKRHYWQFRDRSKYSVLHFKAPHSFVCLSVMPASTEKCLFKNKARKIAVQRFKVLSSLAFFRFFNFYVMLIGGYAGNWKAENWGNGERSWARNYLEEILKAFFILKHFGLRHCWTSPKGFGQFFNIPINEPLLYIVTLSVCLSVYLTVMPELKSRSILR